MNTYHIHIKGIVQGVGFRPYVYRLAKKFDFEGTVCNTTDGVHIYLNCTNDILTKFLNKIESTHPQRAKISGIIANEAPKEEFNDFTIIASHKASENSIPLTPDFAICDQCVSDISNPLNRRNKYSFTTCTVCGPRYSIIRKIPYDRENTTMQSFTMCHDCKEEFNDVRDRRYFSQTNSCRSCSINLSIEENLKTISKDLTQQEIITYIVNSWRKGKIIAVKGLGGYMLTCDATRRDVVLRLRKLKTRPSKPLAVMYPDMSLLEQDVDIDETEMEALADLSAPISLANKKISPRSGIATEELAPSSGKIGVLLPYAPVFVLLLREFGKPIVATSGNFSGDPIEYINSEASIQLNDIADGFLHNDRSIVIPQDDSVINFSPVSRQKIILRRSRGLAPSVLLDHLPQTSQCVLSMGGLLKSTFGLAAHNNIYISQYIGDTDTYKTQNNYNQVLNHLLDTFNVRPEAIISDMHPGYFSTSEGEKLSYDYEIPLFKLQHHKAHFYAILSEHKLLKERGKILGVIWDGTGLGEDGHIWGGEFFIYDKGAVTRAEHVPYFYHRLGDKMAREPRISALTLLNSYGIDYDPIRNKFNHQEWGIYSKLISSPSSIRCSSMGRLFDAISSLVMGKDIQTYEGEAAMKLEDAAYKYLRNNFNTRGLTYLHDDIKIIDPVKYILMAIVDDMIKGLGENLIAARFHVSLVDYIARVAEEQCAGKLAFSGGTFQNALLTELILQNLGKKYDLYFHNIFSPNDENIAFGQLMHHIHTRN